MKHIKLWIDDIRPAPKGYQWIMTTNAAIAEIRTGRKIGWIYDVIDLDHDAGEKFSKDGGDYINILKWMEQENINNIPIHLHTQNSAGRENMRAIINHNGWKEIF